MTSSIERKVRDKITAERTPRTEDEMVSTTEPARHRFTVEEYRRLGEIGFFAEDDRVELIRGEIIDMNPIGVAHMNAVTALNRLLSRFAYGHGMDISVQNPVRLDEGSEPEPDIALIASGPRTEIPSPKETSLVIEVSDTTLSYDRDVKLPLYAESGVPEAWIVDLGGKKIEVHSEPSPEGYRATRVFAAGEEARSATLEDLSVSVDGVLA